MPAKPVELCKLPADASMDLVNGNNANSGDVNLNVYSIIQVSTTKPTNILITEMTTAFDKFVNNFQDLTGDQSGHDDSADESKMSAFKYDEKEQSEPVPSKKALSLALEKLGLSMNDYSKVMQSRERDSHESHEPDERPDEVTALQPREESNDPLLSNADPCSPASPPHEPSANSTECDESGATSHPYNLILTDWKLSETSTDQFSDSPTPVEEQPPLEPKVDAKLFIQKRDEELTKKKHEYYKDILEKNASWQIEHAEIGSPSMTSRHWWDVLRAAESATDSELEPENAPALGQDLENHLLPEKMRIEEKLRELDRQRAVEEERLRRLEAMASEQYQRPSSPLQLRLPETPVLRINAPFLYKHEVQRTNTTDPTKVQPMFPICSTLSSLTLDGARRVSRLQSFSQSVQLEGDTGRREMKRSPSVVSAQGTTGQQKFDISGWLQIKEITWQQATSARELPAQTSYTSETGIVNDNILASSLPLAQSTVTQNARGSYLSPSANDTGFDMENLSTGPSSTSDMASAKHEGPTATLADPVRPSTEMLIGAVEEPPLQKSISPIVVLTEASPVICRKVVNTNERGCSIGDKAPTFGNICRLEKREYSTLSEPTKGLRYIAALHAERCWFTTEDLLQYLLPPQIAVCAMLEPPQLQSPLWSPSGDRVGPAAERVDCSTAASIPPLSRAQSLPSSVRLIPGIGGTARLTVGEFKFQLNGTAEATSNKSYSINIRLNLDPFANLIDTGSINSSATLRFQVPFHKTLDGLEHQNELSPVMAADEGCRFAPSEQFVVPSEELASLKYSIDERGLDSRKHAVEQFQYEPTPKANEAGFETIQSATDMQPNPTDGYLISPPAESQVLNAEPDQLAPKPTNHVRLTDGLQPVSVTANSPVLNENMEIRRNFAAPSEDPIECQDGDDGSTLSSMLDIRTVSGTCGRSVVNPLPHSTSDPLSIQVKETMDSAYVCMCPVDIVIQKISSLTSSPTDMTSSNQSHWSIAMQDATDPMLTARLRAVESSSSNPEASHAHL